MTAVIESLDRYWWVWYKGQMIKIMDSYEEAMELLNLLTKGESNA